MGTWQTTVGVGVLGALAMAMPAQAVARPGGEAAYRQSLTRISLPGPGEPAESASGSAALSRDGRFVAFASSSALHAADVDGAPDVYVRDRLTGTVTWVSVRPAEPDPFSGGSGSPSISDDGRYVAFESTAADLVADDTNRESSDVFARDLWAGTTALVSRSTAGAVSNVVSNGGSISGDGRYVAFYSYASNLVADDTNGSYDVFVRDRVAGTTSRVSLSSAGAQGNDASYGATISPDGQYVAFAAVATNLVPGDTNGVDDVLVRDLRAGTTSRVSVSSAEAQSNGYSSLDAAVSAGGRYVAFHSDATNLVRGDTNRAGDIFLRDRLAGTTTRVSVAHNGRQANGASGGPVISPDGRYVAFTSMAANLVAGDTNAQSDVFLRDRSSRTTTRVSQRVDGGQANGRSNGPALAVGARFVAFTSDAGNLVPDDVNFADDVFLLDRAG